MENKNTWEAYSTGQLKELETVSSEYIDFLSRCKTERECTDYIVEAAEAAGFKELDTLIGAGSKVKAGDKVYSVWMNKSVALFKIGKKPLSEGMRSDAKFCSTYCRTKWRRQNFRIIEK